MKKHLIIIVVLLLAAVGVGALALNKYQHRATKPSYNQVASERTQALIALQAQRNVNTNNQTALTNLKGQVTTLTTQKATLCTQIKAARLVQPICQ